MLHVGEVGVFGLQLNPDSYHVMAEHLRLGPFWDETWGETSTP